MPGLFRQSIHRREFLRTSLLSGVAVVVHGLQPSALATPSDDEIHLALLSDPHIAPEDAAKNPRGFDPCAQLQRIVPDLVSAAPRGVIINGDAAFRAGLAEDYQLLKNLLDPVSRVTPVYIGLGNHDDRENFHAAFKDTKGVDPKVQGRHVLIIEEPFIRFIVLDSLLYVNKVAGLLGAKQRAWLAEYLATHTDKPVVFFVHHTLGDGDGELLDANRLFEIIRPHPHVKAIFYGHSHVWQNGEKQGVKLINLPSLAYSFAEQEPVGWVDARFRRDGVSLTLHAIAGNRSKDGEVLRIPWAGA